MEPMNIDWKNIDSVFVRDDLFENINAPKYVDFSVPDESMDDEKWFCRPDCRHPKTADDFKVKHLRSLSYSEVLPLSERNRSRDASLTRRGNGTPENPRSRKPAKNFRKDGENENPNLPSRASPKGTMMTKSRTLKSAIKSSAEKEKATERSPLQAFPDSPKAAAKPMRLKSSNSARNLFGGREILNQITEFCTELKKLALNGNDRDASMREAMDKEPLINVDTEAYVGAKEKNNLNTRIFSAESWKKKRKTNGLDNKDDAEGDLCRKTNGLDNKDDAEGVLSGLNDDKCKGNKGKLQVRSCPPSPQHISSSINLPKYMTPKKEVLREQEQHSQVSRIEEMDENQNSSGSNAGVRPLDVFWFLTPCAYILANKNDATPS